MTIYTAAVVYTAVIVDACQLGRKPVITVPRVEDWSEVWTSDMSMASDDHPADRNGFKTFLCGTPNGALRDGWIRKNALDELNGLYLIMEQLRPYWGVTTQMSRILKQWLKIPSLPSRRTATLQSI